MATPTFPMPERNTRMSDEVATFIRWTVAGVIGTLVAGYTHLGGLFPALLALMVADIIMGVLAASSRKTLNSTISWHGMTKKLGALVMVAVADMIEPALPLAVDLSHGVIAAFIWVEGLSVVENASILGLKVPPQFQDALLNLSKQEVKAGLVPTDNPSLAPRQQQQQQPVVVINAAPALPAAPAPGTVSTTTTVTQTVEETHREA